MLDGAGLETGSMDRVIRIWDPAAGETILVLEGHDDLVTAINWTL